MFVTPEKLVSTSMASRDARGVVYVALAFVVHALIWAAVPPPFALAAAAALILVERLAGELADSVVGALSADAPAPEHPGTFRQELGFELFGPAVSIGMAMVSAVIGLALKPWLAPVLAWLGA